MNDAIPKINNILKIFDPIIFPRAISLSPFLAATILVTSSGRLVPRAIMVSPIKFALKPKLDAIEEAESTTTSPPYITPKSPSSIYNILFVGERTIKRPYI